MDREYRLRAAYLEQYEECLAEGNVSAGEYLIDKIVALEVMLEDLQEEMADLTSLVERLEDRLDIV